MVPIPYVGNVKDEGREGGRRERGSKKKKGNLHCSLNFVDFVFFFGGGGFVREFEKFYVLYFWWWWRGFFPYTVDSLWEWAT